MEYLYQAGGEQPSDSGAGGGGGGAGQYRSSSSSGGSSSSSSANLATGGAIFISGGGQADLSQDNEPTLYIEPNRTSAIDDIRSVVIYTFIITILFSFFLILPGIRSDKFSTFLCITSSLVVTSIVIIALFGTTWHVGQAPISAPYKAFSRDRIQGSLSVRIGLQSVNISLIAHKYYILQTSAAVDDAREQAAKSGSKSSISVVVIEATTTTTTGSINSNSSEKRLPATTTTEATSRGHELERESAVAADENADEDEDELDDDNANGNGNDTVRGESDGERDNRRLSSSFVTFSNEQEGGAPVSNATTRERKKRHGSEVRGNGVNWRNSSNDDDHDDDHDDYEGNKRRRQTQKRSTFDARPEAAAAAEGNSAESTIKRVNVDINYNERFYWIEPTQMRQEYRHALERGLPYPILTVVEYLSQDEAGFSWSRQYRTAGYYSSIGLWLSVCLAILMFCLHCAAPKYGIYAMQALGCLLLFTNLTYALLVPRGDQKLVIPFEGHSLSFRFGWNFWLVLMGGCLSTLVGTIIVIIDRVYPNFIFTTVLDVDFDLQQYNCYKKNNRVVSRSLADCGTTQTKSAGNNSQVDPLEKRPTMPATFLQVANGRRRRRRQPMPAYLAETGAAVLASQDELSTGAAEASSASAERLNVCKNDHHHHHHYQSNKEATQIGGRHLHKRRLMIDSE